MTTFHRTSQALRVGIVLFGPISLKPSSSVPLQDTPDQLRRSFQVQSVWDETGDRAERLRLNGRPAEACYSIVPQLSALVLSVHALTLARAFDRRLRRIRLYRTNAGGQRI